LFEQWRRRGETTKTPATPDAHGHAHGAATVGTGRPSPALMAVAHALTWLLKLDVVLFGGILTGPFFGLLVPRERACRSCTSPPTRRCRWRGGGACTCWRWRAGSRAAGTRSTP